MDQWQGADVHGVVVRDARVRAHLHGVAPQPALPDTAAHSHGSVRAGTEKAALAAQQPGGRTQVPSAVQISFRRHRRQTARAVEHGGHRGCVPMNGKAPFSVLGYTTSYQLHFVALERHHLLPPPSAVLMFPRQRAAVGCLPP